MGKEHLPEYQLIEHDDYWVIPLAGKPVCRFQVDFQLTLEFFEPEDEETIVWISGRFKLELEGQEYELSAEEREKIGPAFALFRQTVNSALAHKDGILEITFAGGGRLTVPPNPNYEAWGVTGVRWLRVVCTPGGDLAVWSADPPDAN